MLDLISKSVCLSAGPGSDTWQTLILVTFLYVMFPSFPFLFPFNYVVLSLLAFECVCTYCIYSTCSGVVLTLITV